MPAPAIDLSGYAGFDYRHHAARQTAGSTTDAQGVTWTPVVDNSTALPVPALDANGYAR